MIVVYKNKAGLVRAQSLTASRDKERIEKLDIVATYYGWNQYHKSEHWKQALKDNNKVKEL